MNHPFFPAGAALLAAFTLLTNVASAQKTAVSFPRDQIALQVGALQMSYVEPGTPFNAAANAQEAANALAQGRRALATSNGWGSINVIGATQPLDAAAYAAQLDAAVQAVMSSPQSGRIKGKVALSNGKSRAVTAKLLPPAPDWSVPLPYAISALANGEVGPAGPAGPQGPQGVPGPTGGVNPIIDTAGYAYIGGGINNTASGGRSTLGGGSLNRATGFHSTVSGGEANSAAESYSTIGGGYDNEALGEAATIGGGDGNTAAGNYSTIGGGSANTNNATYGFLGGGSRNTASGMYGIIAGGEQNTVSFLSTWGTIGGGRGNSVTKDFAVVVGGSFNTASGERSFVGGGQGNAATNTWGSIVGGEGNTNSAPAAFIGGGQTNTITEIATNAVIGGGQLNNISRSGATIGGGIENTNSGIAATIGGGQLNNITATATNAVIGGGQLNTVIRNFATIGGGRLNTVSGNFTTIGGGNENTASAAYATVPGGYQNEASGNDAFAAGALAKATNSGAFVWGIADAATESTNNNSFTARSPGGARFITATDNSLAGVIVLPNATAWTVLSDEETKTDFARIEPREVLAKLAAMPVTSWRYKHDDSRRYIGPSAQDFMAAFQLGHNDKGINTLDADGVTFAAIQGLVEEIQLRDEAIEELESWSREQGARRKTEIDELKAELRALREEVRSNLPPAE